MKLIEGRRTVRTFNVAPPSESTAPTAGETESAAHPGLESAQLSAPTVPPGDEPTLETDPARKETNLPDVSTHE